MTNKKDEVIQVERATQVAYFSLRGLHVTPYVRSDGRVVFTVRGAISKVLAELQGNPSVPILDYIQRFETVRGIIFTLKNGNGKENKKDGNPSV